MNGRSWTAAELARLRQWYGQVPTAAIARRLGRTVCSVLHRAEILGLDAGRFWSPRQDDYLRAHYGRRPLRDLVAALGRSAKGIWQRAHALGLTRKTDRPGAQTLERLRELAGAGYCNRCIGRAVGFSRQCVRRWRQKLGLPPVANCGMSGACPSCIAAVRARTATQCEAAGVRNLAELRRQVFARRAVAAGWPAECRSREVQILDALWERGPLTRRELAAAIGLNWRGSRKTFGAAKTVPGQSYLAHLQRLGLVVNLGRLQDGRHYETVYGLSLQAEKGACYEPDR